MQTDALQREIQKYAALGFFVVHQTETTAQLRKPKQFNILAALVLGVVLFIVGAILYVFWYMAQKDALVYLSVDHEGVVHATGTGVTAITKPRNSWEAWAVDKSVPELQEELERARMQKSAPEYIRWLENKIALHYQSPESPIS